MARRAAEDDRLGMSSENVERVRRGLGAWGGGDLDATLAFMDPQVEWRPAGVFPGVAPVYRGHAGYRRFWDDFRGLRKEIRIVPERLVDHGDQIVLCGRFEARGRKGVRVGQELGIVFTIRDGVALRIDGYPSGEQALASAGLEDPGGRQDE